MRALLVRHGQTNANLERRYLGRRDPPLNEKGHVEADRAAAILRDRLVTAVYSSDLVRAWQTAERIAAPHGLDVIPAPALREMDIGALDGLPVEDGIERFPEFAAEWRRHPGRARTPGGETLREVQDRAWAFLTETAAAHGKEEVAFVTHTFVLLAVLCRVMGLPLDRLRRMFVRTGAVSVARIGEGPPQLLAFNAQLFS